MEEELEEEDSCFWRNWVLRVVVVSSKDLVCGIRVATFGLASSGEVALGLVSNEEEPFGLVSEEEMAFDLGSNAAAAFCLVSEEEMVFCFVSKEEVIFCLVSKMEVAFGLVSNEEGVFDLVSKGVFFLWGSGGMEVFHWGDDGGLASLSTMAFDLGRKGVFPKNALLFTFLRS